VDVSSLVSGDGPVGIAITSLDTTATRITSRQGANPPQLLVPAPPSSSPFLVTKVGSLYSAQSQSTSTSFVGSLKFVLESAAADLAGFGGGTIEFGAGTFDFGSEYMKLYDANNIVFQGAGMDLTVVQNYSTSASDTEPFNFTGAFGVVVRDLTVSAGGSVRSTSDALDFDQGNDVVVERVKVIASRGRGIVFDGKNFDWESTNNMVRDCVITGIPGDGIELLASSGNTITGCTITNVGGHGIQVNKASTSADQPNKQSNDNVLTGNVIDQAGQDGININSGDGNLVSGNTITNSSDDTSGRDGIRITFADGVSCDDNTVSQNTATDNQATKTQKYGLNVTGSTCHATVIGPGNNFAGNLVAEIRDLGSGSIYL
jgi:parallel beta-helix repeat protein